MLYIVWRPVRRRVSRRRSRLQTMCDVRKYHTSFYTIWYGCGAVPVISF